MLAAASRLDSIERTREEMGLVSTKSALENAPPSLAFATVAMGAFRGLVVDILWMRADKLKDEGHFFDAKQLAEWITVLQPRFAAVWDFHGWNMAYNISVAIPNTQWEERWRWVRNGYELIRDKGLGMNPQAIILYRSLAWIFQHKIGGVTDDCHMDYKRELALSMRPLLGPATKGEFELLNKAPDGLSQLTTDPDVAGLVDALVKADATFADREKFAKNYISLRQVPERFAGGAHEVINQYRETPAMEKVDRFARAYQLRNEWKLDIDLMIRLNDKYGPANLEDPNERAPLNWEHPDVHAMYWAQKGLDVAGKPGTYSIDEKNTDRIIFHSLQSLFRTGKIIIYPTSDGGVPATFLRPDLEMFDSCNEAWIDRIEKYEAMEKGNPKAVRGGHKNFLINAVALFYQAGHRAKAAVVFSELKRRYHQEDFNVPLFTFVRNRVMEELESVGGTDATEIIEMSLREAYFRYAVRDDNEATGLEKWSREIYDVYQREYADGKRTSLPPFEFMRYMALNGFIGDEFYPDYLKTRLLGRIQIERPELFKVLTEQEDVYKKLVEEAAKANSKP
jgi:hypothetical protein